MSFEKFSRSYFGNNLEKAKRNYEAGVAREKLSFQKKYPSADAKDFVFDADLSKTGDLIRTFTKYRDGNGDLFDITGYAFKKFYANKLYWQPRIWDPNGTVQPFVPNTDPLPYDVTKFTIYVTEGTEKEGFLSNFEALERSWSGTAKDITKVAVDKDDPYFACLLAACIVSHVGGISRKHLVEFKGTPKVVTSIARYYVYYHMKRFTEDPRKMDSYITSEMKELVKANLQTETVWRRKFVRTRENISLWYQQHPNKRNIRRYRYVMTKNNTGVLGIEYEEVDHVMPKSDDDWTTFIKEDSDGLTKTGQKLFQLAAESYVYSVLGAQAQTRWPIVSQGAKSLHTQDIFHRFVKDTVTQDDPVRAISDLRLMIKNTNVVLNLAISPGLILIPSDVIVLKEKVAGYNNTLTLATKGAKSLHTQDIFQRFVKDTVTQDDPVKAISDMRLVIKNTNVVLSLAISPGLILIPSDMIILKEKVAGYNNTLTLATKEMKFGVNEEVNKVTLPLGGNPGSHLGSGKTEEIQTTQGVGDLPTPSVIPEADETACLLGTAVTLGFMVARYVI